MYGLATHEPLTIEDYAYPPWSNALGWCIAASSMLCIPGMAIYKIATTRGTLRQVVIVILTQVAPYILYYTRCEFNRVFFTEIEDPDYTLERSSAASS